MPTTLDRIIDLSILNANAKKNSPVWDPILHCLNIICTLNHVIAFSHNTSKSPKTNMSAETSILNAIVKPYCPDTKNDYLVPDKDGICISRPFNFSLIENNSKMYP